MAVLKDPHERAVGGGDRQQGHDDRLERKQHGVEEQEQHDVGDDDHEADRERSVAEYEPDEVEIESGLPGHQHLTVVERMRPPDVADERPRLLAARTQIRGRDQHGDMVAQGVPERLDQLGRPLGRWQRGHLLVHREIERGRKGSPKRSSTQTTGTKTRQGWAITITASRCQSPSPLRSLWRKGTRSTFTRGPSTARSAGKVVRPYTTARVTTLVPAQPIEPRLPRPKNSMPSRPIATVRPENKTARPAVATVRASASTGGRSRISSRKRLTTKSE